MNALSKFYPNKFMAGFLCLALAMPMYAHAQSGEKPNTTSQESKKEAKQEAKKEVKKEASPDTKASGAEKSEGAVDIPESPHPDDAKSLLAQKAPKESELSAANIKLLAENAQLQSRIEELTTQLNVLVNERSGQLYLYGVFSVLISLGLGVALGLAIAGKKKSDW